MNATTAGRILWLSGLLCTAYGSESLAQVARPPLDFSEPAPSDTSRIGGIPDLVLQRALASYNSAGTRTSRDFRSSVTIAGTLGLYLGQALVGGHVGGDVVMINGDLRLESTARIDGRVIVLGGRLHVDSGAVLGESVVYGDAALVDLHRDGTLSVRRNGRSLRDYASTSFSTGNLDATARFSLGSYNRVEEFPLRLTPTLTWRADSNLSFRLQATGIARTATPQDVQRKVFGWSGSLTGTIKSPWLISAGLEAGNLFLPTSDQPFPEADPGLTAFLLRRDYRDWYASEYWGMFASMETAPHFTVGAGLRFSRDASARAVDAFSLLRSQEEWRPNPLIDDGRFVTTTLTGTYDTRDVAALPTSGWYARGELRRTTSHDITPVSLPATIRGDLDVSHYAASELNFDTRFYHRLTPTRAVHLRLAGGGSIAGDPLTVQRRRALGGNEPIGGYAFRALNCDRRRRPDAAIPALCDREMIFQAEYRQALRQDLSTRVGGYAIGFQQPNLVLFLDAGSSWLSGPGEGQVPSNRIQSIGEWRSSVGIGLEGRLFGVFLAKAIADPEPVRLFLRLGRRF